MSLFTKHKYKINTEVQIGSRMTLKYQCNITCTIRTTHSSSLSSAWAIQPSQHELHNFKTLARQK